MLKGKGILTPGQQAILHLLGHVPDITHFYLTGGTALAEFYMGHRRSFDLDLFTAQATLIRPFSLEVERRFHKQGWSVRVIRRFSTAVALQKAETFPDELPRWPVVMLQPFDPRDLKQRFVELARRIMDALTEG